MHWIISFFKKSDHSTSIIDTWQLILLASRPPPYLNTWMDGWCVILTWSSTNYLWYAIYFYWFSYTLRITYVSQDLKIHNTHALKHCKDRLGAKECAEVMVAICKEHHWFVHEIMWHLGFPRSFFTIQKPQSRLGQISYLLTCWGWRHVSDSGYLEVIDIMEEEKEYWELFLKIQQDAQAWAKSV